MPKCQYPDWEGGIILSEHAFGKDGICVVCGELQDVGHPITKERVMFDSAPWQCKSCDAVLGWITEGRLTVYRQTTSITSGDVKCHVCGEMQRFCSAEQQVTSEILNEDGYIDTLHLGC